MTLIELCFQGLGMLTTVTLPVYNRTTDVVCALTSFPCFTEIMSLNIKKVYLFNETLNVCLCLCLHDGTVIVLQCYDLSL